MKRYRAIGASKIAAVLCGALLGCSPSEPSLSEIEQNCKAVFLSEAGIPSQYHNNFTVKAKKVGSGRWRITMTAERFGQSRSLNGFAVMDSNGDIHYYTD